MPKFNGKMESWSKWKRQFVGFLGQNDLMPILRDSTDMSTRKWSQRNDWLYHAFQSKLHHSALTHVKGMKRDKDNVVIPDGREAWKRIRMWYEGRSSRSAMSMYAHKKMSSLQLHSGQAASYLSEMTDCFDILENAE